MRRAEFFLALGGDHDIDGQIALNRDDRLQRIEKGAFRALLVGGATRHDDLAQFVIHHVGLEWRAVPVFRVNRLDVVHHVDHQGFIGTRVVITPDTGVAVRGNQFGLLEAQGLQVASQHFGHFDHTLVLRTDRRLPHPALQGANMAVQ